MVRRFTLLDDVYFDALLRVAEALAAEELPVALVGGGAAQAWIATLRTGEGVRRLSDEPLLRSTLRKTRDLDFASRADPVRMLVVLNRLAASQGHEAHVLGPRSVRLGPVSVSFTLGPEDLAGLGEYYDEFLSGRVAVRLRRGVQPVEVPAIGLAHLLATKLTRRGDKAKDLLDLAELSSALREAGRRPDLESVRRIVGHDPDALRLLAEIELRLGREGQQ